MVQEVKAYRTTDGRVFDQRPAAISHEFVHLLEEGLRVRGYPETGQMTRHAAAEMFFSLLTENDSRVDALLKVYRDCHPRVKTEVAGATRTVALVGETIADGEGATHKVWRRVEEGAGVSGTLPRVAAAHRRIMPAMPPPAAHAALPPGSA